MGVPDQANGSHDLGLNFLVYRILTISGANMARSVPLPWRAGHPTRDSYAASWSGPICGPRARQPDLESKEVPPVRRHDSDLFSMNHRARAFPMTAAVHPRLEIPRRLSPTTRLVPSSSAPSGAAWARSERGELNDQ